MISKITKISKISIIAATCDTERYISLPSDIYYLWHDIGYMYKINKIKSLIVIVKILFTLY